MGEIVIMPKIQKKRIVDYLNEGKRFDGRKPTEFRDIKVELNISENAEGSCSVKIGETEVYAGVKMALVTPYPDGPSEGTLSVGMEMGPLADDEFQNGPPTIESIEVARVIDRGIRESKLIDFEKLCVVPGEKVWQVSVDMYAVNNDGNLFDAAGLAALIALANAKLPVYNEEEKKIEHKLSKTPVPVNKENMSFNITVHKVGNTFIVDPTREEEIVSDYRLSMAIGDNGGEPRITAMQKGKAGGMSEADMESILKLVEDQFSGIHKTFSKLVWGK
ncbi:exosome complex protein Rrp42 [Candidatus Pacearchaeota archaeon]|nr:exosome complex protein Rrp42 [Candidatus Pacearchaeota archaeon]